MGRGGRIGQDLMRPSGSVLQHGGVGRLGRCRFRGLWFDE